MMMDLKFESKETKMKVGLLCAWRRMTQTAVANAHASWVAASASWLHSA